MQTQSSDITQQFGFKDELALFVFFRRLESLVIFPAHRFMALVASDITDNVSASRHVALIRIAGVDVDDSVEQVRLAMLAAEVLAR